MEHNAGIRSQLRQLWRRVQRRLHPPRGIHRAELLVAVCVFALPLALVPYAGLASGSTGGPMWQPVASYAGGNAVQHLAFGVLGGEAALYAADGASGIVASVDGGVSWTSANVGLPHGRLQSVRLVDLAVDATEIGVMYAAVDSPAPSPRPMLYWTVDGGRHWQPRANLGRERVQALATGAGAALYVATQADVRRATLQSDEGSPPTTPAARYAAGRDDLRYEVLGSLDAQAQVTLFEALSDTLYLGTREGGLQMLSPATAGAAAQGWIVPGQLQGLTVYALCAVLGTPQTLYAGTSDGLFASNDAGQTWSGAGAALGDRPVLSLCAPAALPGVLLAGVAQTGVWISRDAGVTWSRYGTGMGRADVSRLVLDDRSLPWVLYAGTSEGLWRLVVEQG